MHRRLLALAASGAMLVAAAGPMPTSAAGPGCTRTGDYTVCTAVPQGAKDTTIVSELVHQIDATEAGDTVRAAVYQWTLDGPVAPLAESLVHAEGRGVDVRAVIGTRGDRPSMNDAVIRTLKAAGALVRQCGAGCLPNAGGTRMGPDHNRFFLIDHSGTPTVMVTSFSFTRMQSTQSHNLLGVHGDRQLFDFYTRYWNRLYSGRWHGWTDDEKGTTAELARAWVFPRGPDPVVEQLGRISACEAGDRVLVGHANFQTNRPGVRAELDRIQALGCQVRAVVLDAETNDPQWIEEALGAENVRVHDSHRNKFMVAEAWFGDRHRAVVWTGTHNLSGNAMRHADDNLIRVADEGVADLYTEFFVRLWAGGR